jgi:CHASE3 domain sensor protein
MMSILQQRFNNLKVGTKVTLILGLVTFSLIVMSIVAIMSMRQLTKNTNDVFEQNLKPIAIMGLIRQNIPHTRVLLRDMIIFTDKTIVDDRLKEMESCINETNVNISNYRSMISSTEEQSAFQDLASKT